MNRPGQVACEVQINQQYTPMYKGYGHPAAYTSRENPHWLSCVGVEEEVPVSLITLCPNLCRLCHLHLTNNGGVISRLVTCETVDPVKSEKEVPERVEHASL